MFAEKSVSMAEGSNGEGSIGLVLASSYIGICFVNIG